MELWFILSSIHSRNLRLIIIYIFSCINIIMYSFIYWLNYSFHFDYLRICVFVFLSLYLFIEVIYLVLLQQTGINSQSTFLSSLLPIRWWLHRLLWSRMFEPGAQYQLSRKHRGHARILLDTMRWQRIYSRICLPGIWVFLFVRWRVPGNPRGRL